MQFSFTSEERLIQETARRISRERLAPLAAKLDRGEGGAEKLANLKVLAENGFMALNVNAAYGGSEAGSVAFALAIEELAYSCAATTVATSVTNMVCEVIQSVGNEEQKQRFIPPLAGGRWSAGGFCLTESGAGSDPAGMKTRARRDGNGWRLDGEKQYISSGEYAGIFIVWAVTDPDAPKGKGISCFLVEASMPGLRIGKSERKMGQRGSATNTVHFDNCRVDADCMLGAENAGFRIAVGELYGGRISIGAMSVGIARAAMDAAKSYVKQRRQFGQAIADFQGIQWMIADRETEIEAARLLYLSAAVKKGAGEPYAKEAAMAKLFGSEMAHRATDTAIQLFGGAGYIEDNHVERFARDARILRIYEGTSEIQRMIIARETMKDVR